MDDRLGLVISGKVWDWDRDDFILGAMGVVVG
jgi:hypothetical protein